MRMQLFAGAVQLFLFAAFSIYPNRGCQNFPDQAFALVAVLGHGGDSGFVEAADDFFAGFIAEGAEEQSSQNALFSVDLRVDEFFLLIDLELEPASAVRNDAARVDAFLVRENNAGRTMDLGYDDALGAVDHEGSAIGHERNIAHVYIFLTDFARLLENQIYARFQWNRIG